MDLHETIHALFAQLGKTLPVAHKCLVENTKRSVLCAIAISQFEDASRFACAMQDIPMELPKKENVVYLEPID